MADVKISALPAASTPLTGAEVLPIVQSSVTTKVAVSNLTAGLSGTASININGTVGATTPTTGAFTSGTFSTTLGVTGTSTLAAVNASGLITTTAVNGLNIAPTTNTNEAYLSIINAAGTLAVGMNNSAGSPFTPVGNYGSVIYRPVNTEFAISRTTTTDFKISATGAVTIPGTLGVSTGAAVGGATPGAGGVTFPTAGGSGSETSTTQSYYAEGTWTPNQGSGLTVVGTFASVGVYNKIGRVVYISGYVSGSTSVAVTAGAQLTSNLPFTVSNALGTPYIGASSNNLVTFGGQVYFQGNSTIVLSVTTFTANPLIFFTGFYFV